MIPISFDLNGRTHTTTCTAHESLRTVLRRAGMFSVRFGSDSGETGAGAVLLDGELVSSDVVLAAQADGHRVAMVCPRPPQLAWCSCSSRWPTPSK